MIKYLGVAGLVTSAVLMLAAVPAVARVNVDLHVIVPGPYVTAPPAYVQPSYVEPAPVYVQPPPIYVQPRPLYVQPAPVYVQPSPVYVQPRPVWGYGQQWHDHRRHSRRDQDHDGIPNRRDRDRDGDGVPNRWDQQPRNPYRY